MEATMSQKLTWAEQQELEQEQRVERWAFSTAVERIRELSGEASYEITDRDTQAEFYDGYRSADDKDDPPWLSPRGIRIHFAQVTLIRNLLRALRRLLLAIVAVVISCSIRTRQIFYANSPI